MIEQDTVKLLRECDAGVKMGVKSIDDVLQYVHAAKLKELLTECKEEHEKLGHEIQELLDRYKDDGKDPNPMAKGMSWMKTNVKLAMNESDHTIADLITDGCNMGGQVPQSVSQPVQSRRRGLQGYRQATHQSGGKAGGGYPRVSLIPPKGNVARIEKSCHVYDSARLMTNLFFFRAYSRLLCAPP